jgi:hypothetical protein
MPNGQGAGLRTPMRLEGAADIRYLRNAALMFDP